MLVTQMTPTDIAMTALSYCVVDAPSPELRETNERSMTPLSSTFTAQVHSLKRHKAKASQTVRVERVTVEDGGQAIVGTVQHGGWGKDET